MNLVEFGNKYYDEKKPWILFKENTDEFYNIIYNCTNIIANLANLFEPVVPEASNKLKKYLDINLDKWENIIIEKNITLSEIEPLFEKIK